MRVIVGSIRRLLLKALDGLDTRPITDRIKETLFNMPQPKLTDCMFLDPFPGSRAIGVETLSRRAGLVVMTEDDLEALGYIRENPSRTKLEERAMVMGCDVTTGLKHPEGGNYKFGITFMDPPYNHEYERLAPDYLSHSSMVTGETLTVIEASRGTEFGWLEESGWRMVESKEYKTDKHVFVGKGEQMRIAVYPGGFDPVTLSHYDIIECTAKMVDKLTIGVLNNEAKCPLFSARERVNMLKEVISPLPNVKIQSFGGLLIDFVCRSHADVVVRGLRVITDFKCELQMAQTNRVIAPEADIIFLTTNLRYPYLGPSIVKEIAEYEGDISKFPHPVIAARIREKLEERRRLT